MSGEGLWLFRVFQEYKLHFSTVPYMMVHVISIWIHSGCGALLDKEMQSAHLEVQCLWQ